MKVSGKLKTVRDYFSARKYVLWLLLWVVYVVWYFFQNKYQTNSHVIHMAIDDKIPFIEYFVIPYVMWYGYLVFAQVWTFFTSKRDFLRMCCLLFIAAFSSLIVCSAYPSMHTLRPDEAAMGDNVCSAMVKWLYGSENPYCILPSMHCFFAIVISVGLIFSERLKGNLLVKILCPIYTVLVMLATVFIKQHSFADVLLAIGMSVPTCLLTYFVILPDRRFEPKSRVRETPASDVGSVSEEESPVEEAGEITEKE